MRTSLQAAFSSSTSTTTPVPLGVLGRRPAGRRSPPLKDCRQEYSKGCLPVSSWQEGLENGAGRSASIPTPLSCTAIPTQHHGKNSGSRGIRFRQSHVRRFNGQRAAVRCPRHSAGVHDHAGRFPRSAVNLPDQPPDCNSKSQKHLGRRIVSSWSLTKTGTLETILQLPISRPVSERLGKIRTLRREIYRSRALTQAPRLGRWPRTCLSRT